MARQGKIARLDTAQRGLLEQVNQMLLDGYKASIITSKLNAIPEVQAMLAREFDGKPITESNLSDWRQGGHKDWLAEREQAVKLRAMAEEAASLVEASKSAEGSLPLSDAGAAILAGKLFVAIKDGEADFDFEYDDPEKWKAREKSRAAIVKTLCDLRNLEQNSVKLALDRRKLGITEEALALNRDKFQRATVEQFMKWAASKEAQSIITNGQPKLVQMDMLRELFFGPIKEAASDGSH